MAVGADGWHLLGLLYDGAAPAHLRAVPAVDTLRRVWLQQYVYERSQSGGEGRLRSPDLGIAGKSTVPSSRRRCSLCA
jgi:hypothetical protein